MTKERIEELFNSGAITFQEALELYDKNNNKVVNEDTNDIENDVVPENTSNVKGVVVSKKVIKITKDWYIDNFIEHLFDPIEEDGETIEFMDVENIVNYMDDHDWKWAGETVTEKGFKEQVCELVRDVLKHLFKQIDEGISHEDAYAFIEAGGIKVEGNFFEGYGEDEGKQKIEINVSFSIDQGFADFNYDEYSKLDN